MKNDKKINLPFWISTIILCFLFITIVLFYIKESKTLEINDVALDENEILERCDIISKKAELVMKFRQDGVDMKELMETAVKNNDDMLKGMALDGYRYSIYDTTYESGKEARRNIIDDFKNKYYRYCIEEHYK